MAAPDLAPRELCHGVVTHPLGVSVGRFGVDVGKSNRRAGVSDAHFLDGLRRAAQYGMQFMDTADFYGFGHSERVIGRFLREYPDEQFLLSSKVGLVRGSAPHPYAGRHIHHQLEQTLDNLYLEHLDLYFLESFDFGEGDRYLGTAIDQMRTLRQLGFIKAIGMRGPDAAYAASPAERAARAKRFLHLFRLIRPDVVWTRFNAFTPVVPLDGEEDLFSFAAREGSGLVLAAPFAHGLLTGKSLASARQRPAQSSQGMPGWQGAPRAFETIASGLRALRDRFGDARGALTRVALRYCLQRTDRCVVVFGFTNGQQVAENYQSLGAPLTVAELAFVGEVYARMGAALNGLAERPAPALPRRVG
jgi:aryl-alcohol dehydrogenase-like predicted oxidoreductase